MEQLNKPQQSVGVPASLVLVCKGKYMVSVSIPSIHHLPIYPTAGSQNPPLLPLDVRWGPILDKSLVSSQQVLTECVITYLLN